MANIKNLSVTISLKKIISICPLGLFHFSIHKTKIGNRHGRFMVIFADALDYKLWWI